MVALITVLIIQAIRISDPKGIDELTDIVKIYSLITIHNAVSSYQYHGHAQASNVSSKKGNFDLVKHQ